MTNLETKIGNEIKQSMLSKNAARLTALRGIKSQFDLLNSSGTVVTDEMQLMALQKMIKQRKESAEIYRTNGRDQLFQVEQYEIGVIEEFLPKQMSRDEVKREVELVVNEVSATSIKDMGKVIGILNKKLVGKAEGKLISEVVKEFLS